MSLNTAKFIIDFFRSIRSKKTVFVSIGFLLFALESTMVRAGSIRFIGQKKKLNISVLENISSSSNLWAKKNNFSLLVKDEKKKNLNALKIKNRFCDKQDVKALVEKMLLDLPGYANRATQRARRLQRDSEVYSYILLAGKPEFKPLPLNSEEYVQKKENSRDSEEKVEQVFFTTLERQYMQGKAVELQHFHWMLLTKSPTGWRMVMMFSQIGSFPQDEVATPPRDSSNGVIAQGVKTWLRDCRAGIS